MKDYTGKKLAVFGDSIMFGSGNGGYGVGEYLRDKFGYKLYKYCIGGARVGHMEGKSWVADQVKQAIEEGVKPDLIIFDGFTNDCYKTDGVNFDVPLGVRGEAKELCEIDVTDSFTCCFESIVRALKNHFPRAEIIFVRPHRMGRREDAAQRDYGERAAVICRENGVKVADVYSESGLDTFDAEMRDRYTCDSYGWGRGDATHPNAEGYEKFYLPVIEKYLKQVVKMKVLLVNGSPHEKGCTNAALEIIARELNEQGIDGEIFWIGRDPVRGCTGCGGCKKTGRCVFGDDVLNKLGEKAKTADGYVFGSPVHYASPAGAMVALMDRLFTSVGGAMQFKPAASIVSARRAGTTASYDVLNKYIGINNMIAVPSTYWNMVHGNSAREVESDLEGVTIMRAVASNMAWLLKLLKSAEGTELERPVIITKVKTDFIR